MRRGIAGLAMLTLISLLTACHIRVIPPTKTQPQPTTTPPQGPVVQTPPATQSQPTTQPQTPKPTADGKITKSGVYYGLADSHTIEISLDGKPAAMRLSDEVKPQFEQLKLAKDDKIQVTYYENADKQLILTAINLIK